jgi:hypothetical protein
MAEKPSRRLRSVIENSDNPHLKETRQRLLREIRKKQASTRKARTKAEGKSVADVKAEDEFENELFWE